MKINREKILALAAKPDAELWCDILALAKLRGINLPEKTPSHEELESLRAAVTGAKFSLADAMKLIDEYRKKG